MNTPGCSPSKRISTSQLYAFDPRVLLAAGWLTHAQTEGRVDRKTARRHVQATVTVGTGHMAAKQERAPFSLQDLAACGAEAENRLCYRLMSGMDVFDQAGG